MLSSCIFVRIVRMDGRCRDTLALQRYSMLEAASRLGCGFRNALFPEEESMEKRQLLATVPLALFATCAEAQETTWKVEFLDVFGRSYYWSLEPPPSPPPPAPFNLSGLVKGEDRNHDGWIDKSELSELRFGYDLAAGNYATCDMNSNYLDFCTLSHFRFAPDGELGPVFEMTARWYQNWGYRDERLVWVDTGNEYRYEFYRSSYGNYRWTEDTTLRVTQVSPVPEPGGGLMLAAGLAALLGARRWRRPARVTARMIRAA